MSKSPKWEGWVGIGSGGWLFASPWVLGFWHQATPTVNTLVIATILVLGGVLDLVVHKKTHRHATHQGRAHEPEPLYGLA